MNIFINCPDIVIYYVYYSYEEFGRGYIGYHRCPKGKTPETDGYFGSFKDKTFKPSNKIILGIYFSKIEATRSESLLHDKYDVVRNPHFVNKVKSGQTGKLSGVDFHTEETKEKLRQKAIGRKYSEKTKKKLSEMRIGNKNSFYGKNHTEETIKYFSEIKKGDKNPSWNSGIKRNFYNNILNIKEENITVKQLLRKYPKLEALGYKYGGFINAFNKGRTHYKDWEISQDNQQPS